MGAFVVCAHSYLKLCQVLRTEGHRSHEIIIRILVLVPALLHTYILHTNTLISKAAAYIITTVPCLVATQLHTYSSQASNLLQGDWLHACHLDACHFRFFFTNVCLERYSVAINRPFLSTGTENKFFNIHCILCKFLFEHIWRRPVLVEPV